MKPPLARAFALVLLLVTFGSGLLHAAEAPPAPQFEESPLEPPAFRLQVPTSPAAATLLPSHQNMAARGVESVAEALYTVENYPEAEKAALALVAERTKSLGAEHKETLRARLLLAQILFKLDKDAESEAQLQKLLPIMTRVFGAEDRATLVCHSSLLKTLGSQGRDAAAEDPFRQLIATETRLLGPDDAETLMTRRYFARGLWDLGKTDEAAQEYHQVLAAEKRVLGAEDKETLQTWTSLVWLTLTQEGSQAEAEAESQAQELLPLMTKVYGKEHPKTVRCESDLVSALSNQDKNTQVEELCRRLIPLQIRVLGAEDADTLHTRRLYAIALTDLLKLAEAEKEYRQMLPGHEHKFGPETRKTLWVRMMLAGLIYRQYRYAEAEAMLRELLPLVSIVYGADHADTLACQSVLLASQAGQGKIKELEEPYRRLITAETRVNGPAVFETVRTRWRFAGVLFELGKVAEAAKEFREAMNLNRSWLDFEESNAMANSALKAMDQESHQNYADAEATRRPLIARQTRRLGVESPDTLRSRADLAMDLDAQGRRAEAESELRDVLAFQERVLGPMNPDTLGTCHLLAECLRGQGKTQESLSYAQRSLAGQLKILGPDDPETLTTQQLVHAITHPASPPTPPPAMAAPKPDPHDRPVATVNGTPIMASELKREIAEQTQALQDQFSAEPKTLESKLAELKLTALDTLIDQQLLVAEFKRQGGGINPEHVEEDERFVIQDTFKGDRAAFLASLARQGLTLEQFHTARERTMMIKAMRDRITGQVRFSDIEQVEDYYQKHQQRWSGRKEVKLHTLTLLKTTHQTDAETRAQAERLRTKLLSGADFAELARQESKDSHAEDGGVWDWTPVAELSEDVRPTAEKTPPGTVSGIIEATGCYILLRVDDRRAAEAPPFDQVKDEVTRAFKQEKGQKQLDLKLKELREAADIQELAPGPV